MLRVLLVEDEPDLAAYTRMALEDRGMFVHVHIPPPPPLVTDAFLEEFDVALLDLRLPGRSGEEILDEILELRPELPCVAFTATPMLVSDGRWSATVGKPFDPDELAATIMVAAR